MSEKQAKRIRKETTVNNSNVKRKNSKTALASVAAAAVIAAVAALGIYATKDKIAPIFNQADSQTETGSQSQTIAEYAESIDTTVDELLAKCGMTELGLSGDSDISEMQAQFTIDSYAKFTDKTADELKAENGLEGLSNDTNWSEASTKIPMGKIAEQSGMSFKDFAAQNGLPEGITEKTTYEDAIMMLQQASQSATSAETEE